MHNCTDYSTVFIREAIKSLNDNFYLQGYFDNENSVNRLYPQDHWLHSEEEFDANMSKMFEDDGFCWTDEGGIWKQNMTLEQAKAEVNLAEVKANQRAILEREQARLDELMKASH